MEETADSIGEHQAPSNERQAQSDEHQAHAEQVSVQPNSLSGQQPGSGETPTQIEDPSVDIGDTVNNPGPNPNSEDNNAYHQGPNPSDLQMVAYTADIEENTPSLSSRSPNLLTLAHNKCFISSPPESPPTNSKLDEMDKIVASIDSRMIYMESKMTSLESRMLSVDSRVVFMDSKLKSMDSKLEELLRTQSFMKNQSGLYHRTFYDKVDTLAANVITSRTELETSLVRQLAGQQYQLTTKLDMVKLQIAELVEHLKQVGDAKMGEGGKSRPVDGSSRPGGEGPSGGQSSTRGRGRGRGPSPGSYRRTEDSDRFKKKLATLDVETRSEQSQVGQGKTSSEHSGMLVKDGPAKVCWSSWN
ncbi:zinc finger CCCH domain-containing protein 8-like [Dorcoceras hygrometricum]|uniref:Zinc finger CCCH domain-containing protein 8-like n=1 Tax=Dorcoceras hygrometricum TaxID=472368 RepID=A0A2Z7BI71_9LAMI|nr:zinc finger CCCH domain-containing protein 8-like [Dorcoceras hygrometricum]